MENKSKEEKKAIFDMIYFKINQSIETLSETQFTLANTLGEHIKTDNDYYDTLTKRIDDNDIMINRILKICESQNETIKDQNELIKKQNDLNERLVNLNTDLFNKIKNKLKPNKLYQFFKNIF